MKKQMPMGVSKRAIVLINIAIMIILLLLSFISAESLGTFKQGQNVSLQQVCDNCTYVNLTKIVYPNSTNALLGQYLMTKNGTNYNYTFTDTLTLGTYVYTACGDLNGIVTCDSVDFGITPSGNTDNLGLYLVLIGLVYLIGFFGFFGRSPWVSALGGLGMLALGVYFIGEGVIIYRDWLTNAVAYLTLGLGAIFTLIPLIEFIVKEFD